MIAFAVMFGLLAVFVAQSWLNSQTEPRMRSLEASNKKPVAPAPSSSRRSRCASATSLPPRNCAKWRGRKSRCLRRVRNDRRRLKGGKRVVLTAIEPNEPVLSSKITGPGQRATLSAMLRDGLKAVTMRVNDVDGVGGFVLPGDHVDVTLTRQVDKTNASSEVVLQNVRVLAIDQIADERLDKPAVVKAVTLEVDVVGAQKLSLAASVGSLSLMLRKAGEANARYTRRITLSDLGAPSTPTAAPAGPQGVTTVAVRRASTREEYSVPIEGTDLHASAAKGFARLQQAENSGKARNSGWGVRT